MTNDPGLSEREREILRLVATGATNKQIAQSLAISANTVKVHLRNIFAKIGVVSRTEATLYAIREGIVSALPDGGVTAIEDGDSAEEAEEERPAPAAPAAPAAAPRPRWLVGGFALLGALLVLGLGAALLRGLPGLGSGAPAQTPAPTLQRWSALPPLPAARAGMAAAAVDQALYLIGGETNEGVTGSVARFSLVDQTWSEGAAKPTAVADVSAAVVGGRVYVPGGRLADGSISRGLEIYNPLEDRWEYGPELPAPVSAYALAAYEGSLFVIGGWDGERVLSTVWELDPDAGVWESLPPMSQPRAYAAAAVVGESISIVGGWDGERDLDSHLAFYPRRLEDPWDLRARLPQPCARMGAVEAAGVLYAAGGCLGQGLLGYEPLPDRWSEIGAAPRPVGQQPAVVFSGSLLYALGGRIEAGLADQAQAYQAIYTLVLPGVLK